MKTLQNIQDDQGLNEITNPELIKINADNNSKQYVYVHWLSFFGASLILFLCTLALPEPVTQIRESVCNKKYSGDFFANCTDSGKDLFPLHSQMQGLYIDSFEKTQLFLFVSADFYVGALAEIESRRNISYIVTFWEVDSSNYNITTKKMIQQTVSQKTNVYCSKVNYGDIYQKCEQLYVAYQPYPPESSIVVEMKIYSDYLVIDFKLTGYSLQQNFTKSLIAIRYSFLIISVICGTLFYLRFRKLKQCHVVIEQKIILALSLFVVLFNDPLYAITILSPNRFTSIIGVLFIANFLVFLLLFWMVMIHRIVKENGIKDTQLLNTSKILICSALWICMVVSYSLIEMESFNNPIVDQENFQSQEYLAFKYLTIIIVLIAALFLFVNYVIFCRDYDSRLWRYKITGLFQIYFIMIFLLSIFTGSFKLQQFDGNRVLLTIGFFNLYVYYMQYLWAPSAFGLAQQEFESSVEVQLNSNMVYDQLEDEGLKIVFNEEQIVMDQSHEFMNSNKLYNLEE